MSNNTNLSKLANVLDDASDGQFLKSTGSGGVVFGDVAAGTTTVADITALEALTAAQGDMAFVLSNDNVYIRKTAGWYKIAQVTNNQLESVTVTMSGGGTAGDPYALALDGTDTTATGAATDPEGLSVTWSAAAISPTTLSGNNIVVSSVNVATITQGTGASSNVFTIDPVATTGTHNFSLRFSVTDGVNATIDTDKAYTLNFVTTVTDSKYTVLLAEGQGAGNNKTITDSSSSPNSMTISGAPQAGAFSPYREGGYSWDFDGSTANDANGSRITVTPSSTLSLGTGDYTVEMWVKSRSSTSSGSNGNYRLFDLVNSSGSERICVRDNGYSDSRFSVMENGSQLYRTSTGTNPYTGDWEWLQIIRDNGLTKAYVNGSERGSASSTTDISGISTIYIGANEYHYGFNGGIRDFRISSVARSTTVPTAPLQSDSNTLILTCTKGYLVDEGPNSASVSASSSSAKSDPVISTSIPYDIEEYDAADNGGSIFFDGSSDNILVNSGTNLGTGNWTIQAWINPVAHSTNKIIDFRPFTNGNYVMLALRASDEKFQFYANGSNQIISDVKGHSSVWTHVALVRNSGTIKMYVNGKAQTTTVNSTANWLSHSIRPAIGLNGNNGATEMNGYLSDLKVTIGTAEYTANFAPPTSPISSSNAEVHLKGTDAKILDKNGSSSLDLVGSTFPVGDNTSVTYNSNTIYNGKCFSMTGATGEYISVPNMVKLEGTENFTIEAWIYPTAIASYQSIFTSGEVSFALGIHSGRRVFFNYIPGYGFNEGNTTINSTYSIPNNQWSFVQMVRDNNVFKCYLNGTLGYQLSSSSTASGSTAATIGSRGTGERYKGKIQGLRVSKGLVRPSTVPTSPFKG